MHINRIIPLGIVVLVLALIAGCQSGEWTVGGSGRNETGLCA